MSKCKWDREAEDYLIDGSPCRRDSYGDPTKHCTARRTCSNHVATNELTCAQCISRTRQAIKRIVDLSALMMPAALSSGVNSEAAMLAGPGADYLTFSARRLIDKRWIELHIPERNQLRAKTALLADDDEYHPYSVLTRWEFMLREDYQAPRKDATSVLFAADYLLAVLHRVAQDDEQDFPLMAREMRRCRDHMETALSNDNRPERGAPCPICAETGPAPKLGREFGHWCDDEDCTKIHYPDNSGDRWVCPRSRAHWWTEHDYRHWVADWYDEAGHDTAETTAV